MFSNADSRSSPVREASSNSDAKSKSASAMRRELCDAVLPLQLFFSIAARAVQRLSGQQPSPMNIHEYQAKELLQKFGVATPRGKAATTPDEAEQAARELGTNDIVVKAQIH